MCVRMCKEEEKTKDRVGGETKGGRFQSARWGWRSSGDTGPDQVNRGVNWRTMPGDWINGTSRGRSKGGVSVQPRTGKVGGGGVDEKRNKSFVWGRFFNFLQLFGA